MSGASLRVGIVCFPTFGGSGVVATAVGEELARRGHGIHVLSHAPPVRLDRLAPGVTFHEVRAVEYPVLHHVPYDLALASKIVDVALRERLDVLHAHYAVPHATSGYLARQVLGGLGRPLPLVTTLHGTDITLVGSDASLMPITRFSVLASDAVTVPSRALGAETLAKLELPPATVVDVIPNFVDVARWKPGPPRPRGDLATLVHVSNFRQPKRVPDVVRILAAVRKVEAARLVLVGDGPERAEVARLAEVLGVAPYVEWRGELASFEGLLAEADVFLLPSQLESFGLAAAEAMACGVPVVASRVGGLPEVVEDGVTGFLAPVGDVEAMASSVIVLLRDEPRRLAMARAARERVMRLFAPGPAVDQYLAVYRRVL